MRKIYGEELHDLYFSSSFTGEYKLRVIWWEGHVTMDLRQITKFVQNYGLKTKEVDNLGDLNIDVKIVF